MGPGYSLSQQVPVDGGVFRFVNPSSLPGFRPPPPPPGFGDGLGPGPGRNHVGPPAPGPHAPGPQHRPVDGGIFRFVNGPPHANPLFQHAPVPVLHPAVAAALAALGAQRNLLGQIGLGGPGTVNPGGPYQPA